MEAGQKSSQPDVIVSALTTGRTEQAISTPTIEQRRADITKALKALATKLPDAQVRAVAGIPGAAPQAIELQRQRDALTAEDAILAAQELAQAPIK